jgi:hypothetical protein
LFQCLSQQPWIIRGIIKADSSKPNFYNVMLHRNRVLEVQSIDDFIPFIKERKEAMFMSSTQELWPMLLQKGLAKHYGSYFELSRIDPRMLLESMTGFPTMETKFDQISDEQVVLYLQEVTSRNYLMLLRGRKGGELRDEVSKEECFTVLNFYEKN